MHGRNMDQEPAAIRNITLSMEIYSKGKLLGYAVDFYWFNTGFMTAFKPGVASLEENWRLGKVDFDQLMQRIIDGVAS